MSGMPAHPTIVCSDAGLHDLRADLSGRPPRRDPIPPRCSAGYDRAGPRRGPHRVNDLIDTTEMYLRTIFELEEEGIVPLRARIAERLSQSGPTVSQTVARMQRDGLLVVSDDRHLELTDLGRERAIAVMRKHRLAERLLLDVIGLDWQDVHVEACRWEHVMSEQVEQRLIALLGHPSTSPYGNPIPGLDHLGEIVTPVTETHLDLIGADEAAGRGGRYEVRRIIEIVQNQPRGDGPPAPRRGDSRRGARVLRAGETDGGGGRRNHHRTVPGHRARHPRPTRSLTRPPGGRPMDMSGLGPVLGVLRPRRAGAVARRG